MNIMSPMIFTKAVMTAKIGDPILDVCWDYACDWGLVPHGCSSRTVYVCPGSTNHDKKVIYDDWAVCLSHEPVPLRRPRGTVSMKSETVGNYSCIICDKRST